MLPATVADAFAYHERPGALQRLIPPWENIRVRRSDGSLRDGAEVVLEIQPTPLPFRLPHVALHAGYDPPHQFEDYQLKGPFSYWHHVHGFEADPQDPQQCRLTDTIRYAVPLGAPGRLFGGGMVRQMLQSMFAYRHRVTRDDLQMARDYGLAPQKIAISGATGLVGSAFCSLATLLGHQVYSIVRKKTDDPSSLAVWDSPSDRERLGQMDTVIHLAGKPIADQRWTDQVKQEIRDSRVDRTRELCESIAALPESQRPKTLICASATGIYGDRGDEELTEASAPGEGFLSDVCVQWEQACRPAKEAGVRVVFARFGLILSPQSGALSKLLTPTRFGVGGPVGSGRQYWSSLGIDDAIGALYHAMATPSLSGPMNVVSPDPLSNRDFQKVLSRVLYRPSLLPAPSFAMRLALGEMADSLLLASARVVPQVLMETGYRFRFSDLEDCLRHLLGKSQDAEAS